jgi:tetratricopeptide (TPR) repeat protein
MVRIILFLSLAATLGSCSPDTLTGQLFHNTTAHYNGYFYAKEEINRIERTIRQNHQDDYNSILWLFPAMDSLKAKGYDKEVQEAIKMASIAIQRHPGSKWMDDAYLLVGKARLYSFDWGNAIQTFKYINNPKVTKDVNTRHAALIWLLRTYAVHREFNNAEAVVDYLQKENLSRNNRKHFLLEKAYYHQLRGDFDGMIRALSEAEPLFTRRDRPGRYYFIMGQVYQHLGFESEAYNFYRKAINTHPEYEIDFYARLYMAQVAEISRSRDVAHARKSFRKLLTDSKNRDFKDKIYYEMGLFEEKQGNLKEALNFYKQAVREGNNRLVNADAYSRIGHLYYDSLRNYELAQAYYDSAVNAMPPSRPGYAEIKKRQEVLNEFVKHYKTIKWNDSLLTLAQLDTASLRRLVEEKFKATPAQPTAKRKKSNEAQPVAPVTEVPQEPMLASTTTGGWYFSNPTTLATGRAEFLRVWGRIPLEDNWRKSSMRNLSTIQKPLASASDEVNKNNTSEQSPENKTREALRNLMAQIPYTDSLKNLALSRIEESLFALGDIYYFRLGESANAVTAYQTLLQRFPQSEHEAEVLYKLYVILKDTNPQAANQYAQQLASRHPESVFNKLLQNPNYLADNERMQEKQKILYADAYNLYQQNRLQEASILVQQALQLEETAFRPWLVMLDILITGRQGNTETYQQKLQQFIDEGGPDELVQLSRAMLQAARSANKTAAEKPLYSRQIEEPHYFVVALAADENMEAAITQFLNNFNKSNFADLQLKVSRTDLNNGTVLILVSDLPRISAAIEYFRLVTEKHLPRQEWSNRKFSTFVISKGNFNILYRTQQLNEYLEFFSKVYRAANP